MKKPPQPPLAQQNSVALHPPLREQELDLSLQWSRDCRADKPAEITRHFVARCLRHALARPAQLAVRMVDAEEGRQLNATYRQKDYATNVLTFEYGTQAADPIIADIVLCVPIVAQEAAAQNKTLVSHYAHMLVHSALHAQGMDHETSAEDAQAMETAEIAILARLGYPSPY